MELLKAELIELKPGDPPVEVPDSSVPVQFNPTTLRLQISNQAEGGKAQGRPARQYIATSTVLSMDLVFDTADEGTSDEPRSVRERTAMVERFVLPKEKGTEAPPKLRFRWGDGLQFDGVVSSVNVDFDHFAANGVPLRAKVGLSLTEQDAKYQVVPAQDKANARQPGENKPGLPGSAGLSGGLGGGLGLSAGIGLSAGLSIGLSASFGFSASASLSLGGETAAGFAARMGLDPGAWRGLDVDLSGGLTLEAGVEVGFDASLNASTGLGASVGFGAGADAPAEAAFGLKADAAVSSGYSAAIGGSLDPQLGAGFALSAAGGVTSAVESVAIVKTTAAAEASREAFALPPAVTPAAPARPGLPEQPRAPLALSGVPSPARQAAAPPAPRPPRVDPRAASFGFGVPLRPSVPSMPENALPAPARKTRDEHKGRSGRPGGCGCGCGGKR
ncbi:MAG TPA: hypothetical protein VH394_31325 [Thermoanaerobaculia bacterium]|jgi:hypothetical protein|nr:hypothetical protein [Thermoanaerobaculia bacterium]